MINYLYGISLPYSVEFLTLDDVYQMLNTVHAAKKYQIPQLTDEIVAIINKTEFSISSNVIAIENIGYQYSYLGEVSQALILKCKEERERVKLECDISKAMCNGQVQKQADVNPLDLFFSDSDDWNFFKCVFLISSMTITQDSKFLDNKKHSSFMIKLECYFRVYLISIFIVWNLYGVEVKNKDN